MKRCKALEDDPRVEEVEYQDTSGSDYRYFVSLKPGFTFRGYGGRMKGFDTARRCQSYIVEG